jgi:hypothetical protein
MEPGWCLRQFCKPTLTINVPVVFMTRYIMVLRDAMQHHYEGHWKGWALKIKIFLGPEMSLTLLMPFGPKKVEIFLLKRTTMDAAMDESDHNSEGNDEDIENYSESE